MKKLTLMTGMLLLATVFTLEASAQVRFRIGLRAHIGPVYVGGYGYAPAYPAPVVYAPAPPVYEEPPVAYAPGSPVVVEPETEVVFGGSRFYRRYGRAYYYRRGYERRGWRR
ncbi:MAG TPA: hypothetical protein VMV20_04880 [Chitinophagaceae bacterium]|nr:hypothetical protein [Chitinophagaceae bacterium]